MASVGRRRRRRDAPAPSFASAAATAAAQQQAYYQAEEQFAAAVERAAQYGGERLMPAGSSGRSSSQGRHGGVVNVNHLDTVHHHPPKEMAHEVGFPVRGGQTLLIAYFPWEAKEADIEREFSKIARVKRVHLVMDKSSNKPRCFGFVKFTSRADAEEALRATMQGFVQLADQRGHIWHIKAEWTKSGDMVVDDSDTELEVVKRKEERRKHMDGFRPRRTDASAERNLWSGASVQLKGLPQGGQALLQPLQSRYSGPAGPAVMHPAPQMHGGAGPVGSTGATSMAVSPQASQVYAGIPQVQHQARPMQPMFNTVNQAPAHMFGSGPAYGPVYGGGAGSNHLDFAAASASSHTFLPPTSTGFNAAQAAFTHFNGQFHSSQYAASQSFGAAPTSYSQASFAGQAGPVNPGFAPAQQQPANTFAFHAGAGFGAYGPSVGTVAQPQSLQSGLNGHAQAAAFGGSQFQTQPALTQQVQAPPVTSGVVADGVYMGGMNSILARQPAAAMESDMSMAKAGAGGSESDAPRVLSSSIPECAVQRMVVTDVSVQDANASAVQDPGDFPQFDMVWQLPKMSLANAGMPQSQPPPASHLPPYSVNVPGVQGSWGAFDDAAAKGMVDGLVGGEDGTVPPWTSTQAV